MTLAEALVKTHRWLTLLVALLITLGEAAVFNSQAAREPASQATAGVAAAGVGSGTGTRRFPAGAVIRWTDPAARARPGVR